MLKLWLQFNSPHRRLTSTPRDLRGRGEGCPQYDLGAEVSDPEPEPVARQGEGGRLGEVPVELINFDYYFCLTRRFYFTTKRRSWTPNPPAPRVRGTNDTRPGHAGKGSCGRPNVGPGSCACRRDESPQSSGRLPRPGRVPNRTVLLRLRGPPVHPSHFVFVSPSWCLVPWS